MHWLILLTALKLALQNGGQSSTDVCRAQIPQTLGRALLQRFPSYRLPLVSDSLAEDIQFNRTQGGPGCILVSRADFNGDGHDDIAVALAPRAGRRPLVAVAFAQVDGWQLSTIRGWTDDMSRQYVDSASPGVHTKAVEGPLRHNERRSLRCPIHGATVFDQIVDRDGTVLLCLHRWGPSGLRGDHYYPSLSQPAKGHEGNGLLLWFVVDHFDSAWERAQTLSASIEEQPNEDNGTCMRAFVVRDPDGYYVAVNETR